MPRSSRTSSTRSTACSTPAPTPSTSITGEEKSPTKLRREALYLAGNYLDKELMNNDYALTDMRETWNWNTFTRRQKSVSVSLRWTRIPSAPHFIDIARQQRHAAHQPFVDLFGQKIAMHIVRVQDRQLFQVLHILPPIPPHTVFLFSKSSLVFSSRAASCKHSLFASRTLPTLPYHFFYTIFFHPCLSPKSFKLGT